MVKKSDGSGQWIRTTDLGVSPSDEAHMSPAGQAWLPQPAMLDWVLPAGVLKLFVEVRETPYTFYTQGYDIKNHSYLLRTPCLFQNRIDETQISKVWNTPCLNN